MCPRNDQEGSSRKSSETPTRPVILVVEDDPESQRLVELILGDEFRTLFAASGDELRGVLADRTDGIDLVLMDLSLRGSEDGIALTQWLRKQEAWKDLPIIATTAHAFQEDRLNTIDAGCDAYVAKPFQRKRLVSMIRDFLAR